MPLYDVLVESGNSGNTKDERGKIKEQRQLQQRIISSILFKFTVQLMSLLPHNKVEKITCAVLKI